MIKKKKNKLLYLLIFALFAYFRLYSLIFAYIHYYLQSAREVRIGVLVKCQNSYIIFLCKVLKELRNKKKNKKQKIKPKKISKKNENKKNKLLYLLLFAHICFYLLIFAYFHYFLKKR